MTYSVDQVAAALAAADDQMGAAIGDRTRLLERAEAWALLKQARRTQ